MGCWFLTVFITFWQPLELSPTSLCEIQALGARFLSWVERFVLWALIVSLDHFELRQAFVKHLLLLKVKPPKWLDIALELSSVWWVLEKFVKVRFASGKKKQELSGVGKVVERDPAWSWPCEQFKLPQRRRRNHGVGDSELRPTNHCVSLGLLSALSSSSSVLPCYILWCALLLSRYCVYPSLNISRSSLHIFCELDCLLREISLNSIIPVRPVWYIGQTSLDWLIAFKVCKIHVLPIHPI
jgi:hypothetical protein